MALRDTTVGLLSKMAKFVRHPTKDWSELDDIDVQVQPEIEHGYTKQSLKEMIERKRRNDFVRRREFDELRKLRRSVPLVNPDAAGRPSFFQGTTTTSKLEERAETIKKIDAIEAQMSKQWWKGKQNASALKGRDFPISAPPNPALDTGVARDEASVNPQAPVREGVLPSRDSSFASSRGTDFAPTQPGGPITMHGGDSADGAAALRDSARRSSESGHSGFSPSKLFSTELGDSLADSEMEEAAIRYANADDAGAEAGLLAALDAQQVRLDLATGWAAALFDLYRATGQRERFDHLAGQCARRFRLTPPVWYSTPELLGLGSGGVMNETCEPSTAGSSMTWVCPQRLDLQALEALRVGVSGATGAWKLDWRQIESIATDAGQGLADVFAQWCRQPVDMCFEGAHQLDKVLGTVTPSGDKSCPLYWWQLRLDALRVMNLQGEFELLALDYCVTFEVSPPAWQAAQCACTFGRTTLSDLERPLAPAYDDEMPDLDIQSGNIPTLPMEFDAGSSSVIDLSGEVLGDAAQALGKLRAGVQGVVHVVITCDRLIRVDFSAAGSLLNWVAARGTEGCHVQFRDVPRLVAAFFNVIGISEYAKIMLRTE